MALRSKILVVLLAVVVLFVGVDGAASRFMVHNRFNGLEREITLERMHGAFAGLQAELAQLESISRNLAPWLVGEAGQVGPELLGGPRSLESCEVELVLVCDAEGRVLWERIEDPHTREDIDLRDFPGGALAPSHPLLGSGQVSGFMLTERGPMFVSACPLSELHSTEQTRGRVIVGRFVTDALIAGIERRGQVSFDLFPLDTLDLSQVPADILDGTPSSAEPHLIEADGDRIDAYRVINDVRGFPVLVAKARIPRDVSSRGRETANDALLSGLAIAVLMLLSLTKLLQVIIVAPLRRLTQHAIELGETEHPTVRLRSERTDEIGILSRELDRMVDEMEKTRQENVSMARMAGVSEVATGILHNVGNVLNSVTVSAGLASRTLHTMPFEDLKRVIEKLDGGASYQNSDPRGAHLVPFLKALEERLVHDRETTMKELRSLAEGVDHIERLVLSQQSHVAHETLHEWSDLGRLVETALEICRRVREEICHVEIVHDFEDLPELYLDRHSLVDILVNLTLNAVHSLTESRAAPARLTFRTRLGEQGGALIEVEDTGKGIPVEDLPRLFNAGFTTRENGHGYGLHMAANAAAQMGARLTARSDGPGQGATFRIELPASVEERRRAA